MNKKDSNIKIKMNKADKIDYLLYLPENYFSTKKKYPLIMFLHGMGERGSNLNKVKIHGIPKLINQGKNFPFIIISPQCPKYDIWSSSKMIELLNLLLDNIIKNYRVQKKRIYLTGLSMGGFGTWALAANYPKKFAAIAPVCGGGTMIDAFILNKMPVWAFHGKQDDAVPYKESKRIIHVLKQNGNNNTKLTIYQKAGHDSWTDTYNNPKLYKWFLKHKLARKAK